MSRDDWFRHTDWNTEIEADFDAHLRRARDKGQPLKIQAAMLAATHPEAALHLLDRYLESGNRLFLAEAYQTQARARLALGDIPGATESYCAALSREAEFPNLRTTSYVEYPLFVAEHGLQERYADALDVLDGKKALLGFAFPVEHFMWHAAKALIYSAQGKEQSARSEAQAAITAADQTSSGLRYHQSLGLVGERYGKLRQRLRELSA